MNVKEVMKEIIKKQPNKTALAKELYVSRITVYYWLNGIHSPNTKAVISRLKTVAKKYNVKL